MPTITVYGNDLSPPARAARMVAEAVGLDVDLKRTYPLRGECKKPEYIKMNPMHQIPTINDGGFFLSESHAIVTYLADKYAKNENLYPKDILKRSIVHERLFFDVAFYSKLITFVKKEPSDELRDNLVDGLETLERFLTTNKFLAGDNLTIADYCCYCTITFLDFPKKGRVDLSKYKNIKRWMELLQKTSPLFKKYDQIRERAIQIYLEDGKY
ncbi:glutathione S-transferase 1-like [Schistocerca americana]|uniref:glutathione S-transferase 1-like n=1 Tax=Schistocerca americana TaxID=7009 RepID=UPI001F4FB419|nr:glutathione S-transferase 1-like [Schistocerca americana]XP_049948962.1 glutathione S-transferase 1-like [Schistocerca serialis cubense]